MVLNSFCHRSIRPFVAVTTHLVFFAQAEPGRGRGMPRYAYAYIEVLKKRKRICTGQKMTSASRVTVSTLSARASLYRTKEESWAQVVPKFHRRGPSGSGIQLG